MKIVDNRPTTIECKNKGKYAGADQQRWVKRTNVDFARNPHSRSFDFAELDRGALVAIEDRGGAEYVAAIFAAVWGKPEDSKQFLFFTRTPSGKRAGKEFLARLKERKDDRDKAITIRALQAQLKALRNWGSKQPADLSKVRHPVLVANGDSDRMVPSINTYNLARRLPNQKKNNAWHAGYNPAAPGHTLTRPAVPGHYSQILPF